MNQPESKTLPIPFVPELDSVSEPETLALMLDEHGERRSISSLNWADEFPYQPLSTFSVAHSRTALYFDFFVRCNYLRAENYKNQSPVSEDSCVEVFLQPHEGGPYWNFEFNCIGAVNASERIERPNPRRLSDEEIALIRRYPSCGTRPFCELEGMFTWNLLVVIPLELIGLRYDGTPIDLRGNFYKCASKATRPHYLSWNPIHTAHPDFHRPEFFGKLILE